MPRLDSIKLYNANTGGVDKHDSLAYIHRLYVRSRKLTVRMIAHAVDLAMVNYWSKYKKHASSLGMRKKDIVDLLVFRQTVATNLILSKNF